MLRSPRAKYGLYCFRTHQSVREQVIRPYRQITFFKITVDIITLFCNMLQLPRLLLQLTSHPRSIVTSVIIFSQTNFDHLMLTFPNIFAWGIKTNNQSLHTCEKQAYISNGFCSRVTETKSVTIAPGLPYTDKKTMVSALVQWICHQTELTTTSPLLVGDNQGECYVC